MFSIIVCSIRPDEVGKLRQNIEATIGIPFELIAYDNRNTGKGICQVYNECAESARFEYLCFVHEDVEFLSDNWGKSIIEKLKEKDCGVIGFAGSAMKSKNLSAWCSTDKYGVRMNLIQIDGDKEFKCYENPYNQDFSQSVSIDGLCLMCRKEVWQKVKFDEKTFRHFHCYDIDFSLASHIAGYKNYVCNTIQIKHFSPGNYDYKWCSENKKLHEKYKKVLPLYVKDKPTSFKTYLEKRARKEYKKLMIYSGIYDEITSKDVLGYLCKHPINKKSYKLIYKFIKHRSSKRKK